LRDPYAPAIKDIRIGNDARYLKYFMSLQDYVSVVCIPRIGKESKGIQKASVFNLLLYSKSLAAYASMYPSRASRHCASLG